MRCGNLAVPARHSASPSSAAFTAGLLNPSLWINSLPSVLRPPGGAHHLFTVAGRPMHLSWCIRLELSLYSSPPLTLDLTLSSMELAPLHLDSLSEPTTTRCPSRYLLIPTRLPWTEETLHQASLPVKEGKHLHPEQLQGKTHHQTESCHRPAIRLKCR